MSQLQALGKEVGQLLKNRGETVGIAESSTGGLISATLLAVAGASAFYAGGAVVYTSNSRRQLLNLTRNDVQGAEPMSVEMAAIFAARARATFECTWAVAELGAAGPTGTGYGHSPGISVVGISGPVCLAETFNTGNDNREENMWAFTRNALELMQRALSLSSGSK
jgi:nicotinamide-nucleotide amidase